MKAMKARKAMRAPMKRTSKIAKGKRRRGSVFNNRKEKTASSGLRKADLGRNKRKRIVSKRASTAGAQVLGWKLMGLWVRGLGILRKIWFLFTKYL